MNTSEKSELITLVDPYWKIFRIKNTDLQFQSPGHRWQKNNKKKMKDTDNYKMFRENALEVHFDHWIWFFFFKVKWTSKNKHHRWILLFKQFENQKTISFFFFFPKQYKNEIQILKLWISFFSISQKK